MYLQKWQAKHCNIVTLYTFCRRSSRRRKWCTTLLHRTVSTGNLPKSGRDVLHYCIVHCFYRESSESGRDVLHCCTVRTFYRKSSRKWERCTTLLHCTLFLGGIFQKAEERYYTVALHTLSTATSPEDGNDALHCDIVHCSHRECARQKAESTCQKRHCIACILLFSHKNLPEGGSNVPKTSLHCLYVLFPQATC